MVSGPFLSDVYRTWYLSPGFSTKHGYCSPMVSYQSLNQVGLNLLGLNLLGHLHWRITPMKLKPSFKSTSVEHMLKWNKWSIILPTRLSELWDTAPEVMKTFLRWKKPAKVSLKPRKRMWEIVLVLNLAGLCVYGLVKLKVMYSSYKLYESYETKYPSLILHCFDVLYCLRGSLLVFPLDEIKGFQGFLPLLVVYYFG